MGADLYRALALVVLVAAGCSAPAPVAVTGPPTSIPTNSPAPVLTGGPQVGTPTASPPSGVCTQPGLTNAQLVDRWLDLAGKHDAPAVRDCFAAAYGVVPEGVVQRWADLGPKKDSSVAHGVNEPVNGCDHYAVTADFPNGNPYAPVQDANRMFFVVGVGLDGDRPRIFGTATGQVQRSPDLTPHAGSPDCR